MAFPNYRKKSTGWNDTDAKAFRAGEVLGIERDNEIGAACDRQFENVVVLGVGQERAPEKEDRAAGGVGAQELQDAVDVAVC
jgi:hypothetical protein